MQYAIIALLIIAAVAYIWWTKRNKVAVRPRVSFCVPFSDRVTFDPAQFTKAYRERWGGDMACDDPKWDYSGAADHMYTVVDGDGRALIGLFDQPLEPDGAALLLAAANVSDQEKQDLRGHKSHLMMEVLTNDLDPMGSARFAVRLLFTFLENYPAVGAISMTGQNYQTIRSLRPLMNAGVLDQEVLYLVCTVVHNVPDTSPLWMHTHGMEFFGSPDLEIRYADASDHDYYYNLIRNVALYLMDRGPVMKPGHTAELAGDGVIYQIKPPSGESKKHFGRYGALEIARK